MPRSMGDPNYVYRPWTPERRQRASEAAKERWRQKREAEAADAARRKANPTMSDKLAERIRTEERKMRDAAQEYFRAERAIKELKDAQAKLEEAKVILRRHGLYNG